jgi:hypothetical protein
MPMHTASPVAEPDCAVRADEVLRPEIKHLPEISRQPEISLPQESPLSTGWMRALRAVLLAVAAIFFALHYVHLKADFPNSTPWMDWSKYTDEGWYGDAAIRHYQLGHWNVPGDFNSAAALPVWPVVELAVFRFTGVSLVAARAVTVTVFGLTLLCCYQLLRRAQSTKGCAAVIAVLLLAVSPFCFVFMRLAILEPTLILLMLLSLLVATKAGEAESLPWAAVLGLMLPALALTKTTGVFLFPATFWMLWASGGFRWRSLWRTALLVCVVGAVVWGGYYTLFVRPRYLVDYRYLFSANAYTGITRDTFWSVICDTILDSAWIGKTLAVLSGMAVLGAATRLAVRRTRCTPLVGALLLWIFGYATFLAYHDNLQPRYYLVLAIPLTMLTVLCFDAVLDGLEALAARRSLLWTVRIIALATGGALAFMAVRGAWVTVGFVRHPAYIWVSTAEQVRGIIDRERAANPAHSRLLLSISGSDISLMTGVPSICDDFGTMELPDRVARYKPGWFATWNDVEDDKMDALTPAYRLVRVATIPAFDDPQRNLLILYRLDSAGTSTHGRRLRTVPHRLRTHIGEQPTQEQLLH